MAAAIVKLDTLTDAVGSTAEDHDLFAAGRRSLVLRFVAGIKIRREAFKFSCTGVHSIKNSAYTQFFAPRTNFERIGAPHAGETRVRKPIAFGFEQLLAFNTG